MNNMNNMDNMDGMNNMDDVNNMDKLTSTLKKIVCILIIVMIALDLTACSDYRDKDKLENRSVTCQQPGSFFPEGEQRYILVDESTQRIGGSDVHCYIYADKHSHVMYGYYVRHEGTNAESATMFKLDAEALNEADIVFDDGIW